MERERNQEISVPLIFDVDWLKMAWVMMGVAGAYLVHRLIKALGGLGEEIYATRMDRKGRVSHATGGTGIFTLLGRKRRQRWVIAQGREELKRWREAAGDDYSGGF